jgi:hypothetical protein
MSTDADLQRALELSRQTNQMDVDAGITEIPGLSAEDAQLQKAISASIQSTTPDVYQIVDRDPTKRQREEGVPAGIQNVGNTCYFNSFIQTYLFTPQICKTILSYPIQKLEGPDNKDNDTKNFMKELQRLFGNLIRTNQKWVDPSNFLKSIVDNNGNIVKIGAQEDVSEFSDLFLQRIEKALELVSPEESAAPERRKFTKQMFYNDAVEFFNATEADGAAIEQRVDSEFSNFILPVGEGYDDVHASLEGYLLDEVDYTTSSGFKTRAQTSKWIQRLPPVLMFQQSRVQFNAQKKDYEKITAPLEFPKELFMDRYSIQNRSETTKRRDIVNQWRKQLKEVEQRIAGSMNYKGKGVSLDTALECCISYLSDKDADNKSGNGIDLKPHLEFLRHCQYNESASLKALQGESQILRKNINTAYDDMNKTPYELSAVWIHSGVATTGHYWAYLRDFKNNKWRKFNDVFVSDVDEKTVFEDAIGGSSSGVSAYFLIYVSKEFAEEAAKGVDYDTLMPEYLKKEVEEANKKFTETLENFTKNTDESKVKRLAERYQNKVQQAIDYAATSNLERDLRVKSFYAFLESIGMRDQMKACSVRDHWTIVFERGIDKDLESKAFNLALQQIPEEHMRQAVELSLDPKVVQSLRTEHDKFKQVFLLVSNALTAFFDKKWTDALKALYSAKKKNETIEFEKARRTDILDLIKVFALHIKAEALKDPLEVSLINMFDDIITCVTHSFSENDPFLVHLRDAFLNEVTFQQGSFPTKIYDRLEIVGEALLNPDAKKEMPANWILPTIKDLDEDRYDTALTRTQEMFRRLKTECKDHIALVKQIDNVEHSPLDPIPESATAATSTTTTQTNTGSTVESTSTSPTDTAATSGTPVDQGRALNTSSSNVMMDISSTPTNTNTASQGTEGTPKYTEADVPPLVDDDMDVDVEVDN